MNWSWTLQYEEGWTGYHLRVVEERRRNADLTPFTPSIPAFKRSSPDPAIQFCIKAAWMSKLPRRTPFFLTHLSSSKPVTTTGPATRLITLLQDALSPYPPPSAQAFLPRGFLRPQVILRAKARVCCSVRGWGVGDLVQSGLGIQDAIQDRTVGLCHLPHGRLIFWASQRRYLNLTSTTPPTTLSSSAMSASSPPRINLLDIEKFPTPCRAMMFLVALIVLTLSKTALNSPFLQRLHLHEPHGIPTLSSSCRWLSSEGRSRLHNPRGCISGSVDVYKRTNPQRRHLPPSTNSWIQRHSYNPHRLSNTKFITYKAWTLRGGTATYMDANGKGDIQPTDFMTLRVSASNGLVRLVVLTEDNDQRLSCQDISAATSMGNNYNVVVPSIPQVASNARVKFKYPQSIPNKALTITTFSGDDITVYAEATFIGFSRNLETETTVRVQEVLVLSLLFSLSSTILPVVPFLAKRQLDFLVMPRLREVAYLCCLVYANLRDGYCRQSVLLSENILRSHLQNLQPQHDGLGTHPDCLIAFAGSNAGIDGSVAWMNATSWDGQRLRGTGGVNS
ncbi:hypothetical protein BDN72DRAFT_863154 [Pluteus cervinus]|uniref:Uncharacterized protein n=1 Tax=Pluteus cervinus TaxID=181527 RepID=A0ACD3A8I3_9AGAR|nr:hypothetical protein BDN72DRAFT_863154 [Pluteus cervinus]